MIMLQLAPAPLLNILIINNTAPISHSLIASTLLFSDWLASTLLICSDFSAGTLLISDLTELVNGFWLVWWGSHSSTLHSLKYSNLTTYQLSLNYFPLHSVVFWLILWRPSLSFSVSQTVLWLVMISIWDRESESDLRGVSSHIPEIVN